MTNILTNLQTLGAICFGKIRGKTHEERLESFYGPQADAYDAYRAKFLWGREPMLRACAARLKDVAREKVRMVWIDLGGGTGENVERMAEHMDLGAFQQIYVVDLCPSLCARAEKRVQERGWSNVLVVHADAIEFMKRDVQMPMTLITCSYSLSMIPPFYELVDLVREHLSWSNGIFAVCDFGVAQKYPQEHGEQSMSWGRRFFWRSLFDLDGIDVGPERRAYLKHSFNTLLERDGSGGIPGVPYLKPPYYVWLGNMTAGSGVDKGPPSPVYREHDSHPMHFSMIYNMSWEDPEADARHMDWNAEDVCLTLTGGGCNGFDLLLRGVDSVVSVDVNVAQTALSELKRVAFLRSKRSDVWRLFGEGKHPDARALYEREIEPFLSREAQAFWQPRLWYFEKGLYAQGGMGVLAAAARRALSDGLLDEILKSESLEQQRRVWESSWFCRLFRAESPGPALLRKAVFGVILNPFSLWFGCGVPRNQARMLGCDAGAYAFETFDGVLRSYHVAKDNYFYYNVFSGAFAEDNCPAYLKAENFDVLKERADRLFLVNDTLLGQLEKTTKTYDKVILMDHMDWMDEAYAGKLARLLWHRVRPAGRIAFRSASKDPFYARIFEEQGFQRLHRETREAGRTAMDRVNMYSSFYVFLRPRSDFL